MYTDLTTNDEFIKHHSSLLEKLPNLHILEEKCNTCPSAISALNEYSQIYDIKIRFEQVIPEADALLVISILILHKLLVL